MSTNTKHPKEAWEFLKFIVSPEGQRILAASGSGIPCLKSLAKDPCWRRSSLHLREGPTDLSGEGGHPALNYDAFVNSVEFGMGWEDFLILTRPEVQDAVTQAFEKSFLGQASVEDAFKEADEKINKILREKDE